MRVLKIELSDVTIETLAINIFDKTITTAILKQSYFLRCEIECNYTELKRSIEILLTNT